MLYRNIVFMIKRASGSNVRPGCLKINDFWDPRNNEFLCVFTGKLMILGGDFGDRFWRGFWRGFWIGFLIGFWIGFMIGFM